MLTWARRGKSALGAFKRRGVLYDGGDARVSRIAWKSKLGILKSISLASTRVFCASRTKTRTVRGLSMNDISQISAHRDDVLGSSRAVPFEFATSSSANDGAETLLWADTFRVEASIGKILSEHCNPLMPHFCALRDAWTTARLGHLIMDDAGIPLSQVVHALSFQTLQSIVLQVLGALHVGQELVHFKHHDLHLNNVFLLKKAGPRSLNLLGLEMDLPPSVYYATIADFGLSAATDPLTKTRVARVDYALLADGPGWGKWTHTLCGYEGYDTTYFLHCLADEFVGEPNSPTKQWTQSLMREIRRLDPSLRISRDRGRPAGGAIVRPKAIIDYIMQRENVPQSRNRCTDH